VLEPGSGAGMEAVQLWQEGPGAQRAMKKKTLLLERKRLVEYRSLPLMELALSRA
jgi:hypothetical protein